MEHNAAIEMRGITKRFGQVVANDSIDLTIRRGEILALLGENGSGKTTLMNMLSGIYQPDEGEIYKEGNQIYIHSPREAFEYGIGMIHQHYKLIEVFSAAENIILGLNEEKMDLKETGARVKEICSRYGFDVDPAKKVYDMSVSQKQTVEIIKVLYRGADVLILDEPTAVLTPQETQKLFRILRNMKDDGKAIVIITHKLHEVMEVSDKVAVLRKGRYIGTVNTAETNPQALTDMMVGHAVSLNIDRPKYDDPKKKLIVEGLTCIDDEGITKLDSVSFTAYTGEILGVAGLVGSRRTELLETLFGSRAQGAGTIYYKGEPVRFKREMDAIEKGFAMVTEERRFNGIYAEMGVDFNMTISNLKKYCKHGLLSNRVMKDDIDKMVDAMSIKLGSSSTPIKNLSGGNQQKVILSRWLLTDPEILLLDEPTRGIDVGAKYEIYKLINKLAAEGKAIIVVSSEMPELFGICDRILVMSNGQQSGVFDVKEATQEDVMTAAAKYV